MKTFFNKFLKENTESRNSLIFKKCSKNLNDSQKYPNNFKKINESLRVSWYVCPKNSTKINWNLLKLGIHIGLYIF